MYDAIGSISKYPFSHKCVLLKESLDRQSFIDWLDNSLPFSFSLKTISIEEIMV